MIQGIPPKWIFWFATKSIRRRRSWVRKKADPAARAPSRAPVSVDLVEHMVPSIIVVFSQPSGSPPPRACAGPPGVMRVRSVSGSAGGGACVRSNQRVTQGGHKGRANLHKWCDRVSQPCGWETSLRKSQEGRKRIARKPVRGETYLLNGGVRVSQLWRGRALWPYGKVNITPKNDPENGPRFPLDSSSSGEFK
eukprot:1179959-Prorocentrum_minimum.AAC.6